MTAFSDKGAWIGERRLSGVRAQLGAQSGAVQGANSHIFNIKFTRCPARIMPKVVRVIVINVIMQLKGRIRGFSVIGVTSGFTSNVAICPRKHTWPSENRVLSNGFAKMRKRL